LAALAVVFDFEECGPLGAARGRQTVRQVECNELGEARLIAMWKVPALMSAEKA
jgi:hypothetical protein